MWKQMTQSARKAIFLAQEEAGKLGYNHVGPEHLLLAFMRDERCVAAKLIEQLGIDLGTVRVEVMNKVSKGDDRLGEDMQLTAEAKHVIDMAFDECRRMSDDWVGTEHILLGLVKEDNGIAYSILTRMGAKSKEIKAEVGKLRSGVLQLEGINENAGSRRMISV